MNHSMADPFFCGRARTAARAGRNGGGAKDVSMNVTLQVQLGLLGPPCALNPIWLDVRSVGAASSWSGSYHVLAMGRHYDDYVITGRIIGFPPIAAIPVAHPYERLTGKIRAAGVTGNIGEAIAALFARRCLGAGIGDVAHVRPRRPFRRRKSPDYLMRLGNLMPGPFATIVPSAVALTWPTWWPVESKARSTDAGSVAGRKDALKQLVAYWALLASSQPGVVGYGQIVTFTYQPPREVRVNLILPRNQNKLALELQQNGEDIEDSTLRSFLHAC